MKANKEKKINLDKVHLSKLIRISDPFLMIDKVDDIIPGHSGRGSKYLNNDEWFYKSHFTDEPIMPGTLQIEAMLQTVVAIIYCDPNMKSKNCLITKSSANFYSKINTSGELRVAVQIVKNNSAAIEAKASIFFNNKKVSDGIFKYFNPDLLKI